MSSQRLVIVELITKLCWDTQMNWSKIRLYCDLMQKEQFSEIPEEDRKEMITALDRLQSEPGRKNYRDERAKLREGLLCQPLREAC